VKRRETLNEPGYDTQARSSDVGCSTRVIACPLRTVELTHERAQRRDVPLVPLGLRHRFGVNRPTRRRCWFLRHVNVFGYAQHGDVLNENNEPRRENRRILC
jgi:hypothetical protein